MTTRYVDDGGDNSDGLSWSTAYNSIADLIAAEASFLTTGGNIVYFGSDSEDAFSYSGNQTIVTVANSPQNPTVFISAQVGTTSYEKATANQINTSNGAYSVAFDGSVYIYGMQIKSGAGIITLSHGSQEKQEFIHCKFIPGVGQSFGNSGPYVLYDCEIDATTHGTSGRILRGNNAECLVENITISNVSGSFTNTVADNLNGWFSGLNLSAIPGALALFNISGASGAAFNNVNSSDSITTFQPFGSLYLRTR
jgi:hypothetical protein